MLCRVTVNNRVIARHLAGRCNLEDRSADDKRPSSRAQRGDPEDWSMNHYAAVVSLLRNGVLIYRRRVHGFPAERICGITSRNAGFFPAFRLVVLRLRT